MYKEIKGEDNVIIAITGGAGFLGRYFVRCLLESRCHTPVILSRNNLDLGNGVEVRTTDYSVRSIMKALTNVNAVLHLAAQRGSKKRLAEFNMDSDITQNLYEACRMKAIFNIVYASSISVYSRDIPMPWHEEQPSAPVSLYGISKLDCEHLGNIYARQYGMRIKNLRFAHLFGCNEQNDYMINRFMRFAYAGEPLVLYSKSKAKREFLYAKDAAHALLLSAEAETLAGTYNIGSGEALTNREVAEFINTAFHNKGNLKIGDRDEAPLESSYMLSEKAYQDLGFKARYSFNEAMMDIYREMRDV